MSLVPDYPRLELMVACDQNLGIGKDGTLPWSLPSEFAYFLKMTQNYQGNGGKVHASIFGRANWESIAKTCGDNNPWKDTICYILSRSMSADQLPENVFVCSSFEDIINHLNRPEIKERVDRVWVHGGVSVYTEALRSPYFYRLYRTTIEETYPADVFFPRVDESRLTLVHDPDVLQGTQHENGVNFQVFVFQTTGINPLV
ncbi:dihydrofolate reductase-like [Daphnia pulex]|uniref:dihydrofolate reductase-like n=1 Tax=Daphnia pulex TaxID=6669 RepID=UPI001EDFA0E8|nr:dihydrofolate reductase-like [Daphnia pulex]